MTELRSSRIQKNMRLKFSAFIILCCLTNFLHAAEESIDRHLLDFSIEELMNIEVTTASRRSQKLTEVSAAIMLLHTR